MRNTSKTTTGILAGLAILLIGCPPSQEAEKPSQETKEATSVDGTNLLAVDIEIPQGGDTATDSVSGQSSPSCIAPLIPGDKRSVELENWKIDIDGYKATFSREGDAPEALTFGVIADIKEDTGENMYNIGRLIDWWQKENVDAIIVPGDAGETVDGLARVLRSVAEPGWPVLVLKGNRESLRVYRDGVRRAAESNPNIFDLGQVRLAEFPDATLVSLPGYHDPNYMHEETGCQYFIEDVAALVPVARDAKQPVFLVAHSGPRGATAFALDYAREAGNVGDSNVNRLIAAAKIPFGIFAHIHEAGARATDMTGENMVEQEKFTKSFFVNVGPADSVPWRMNDETQSYGMAGIVQVKDGKAAYWINRLEQLTDQERRVAQNLAPPTIEEAAVTDTE